MCEKKWKRVVGTVHDLNGVTTCGNCLKTTGTAWTDGESIICDECLGDTEEGDDGDVCPCCDKPTDFGDLCTPCEEMNGGEE